MFNRNYRKPAALSLSVVLAGSALLAACGDNKEDAGTKPADATASASASASAASAKPAGPKPKITVSIYDRNNVPEGEGTLTNNRWTKWINENAPVEVEFIPVPRTNSSEKWNVLFASGQAPDLIFEFSNPYMKELAGKGQLMPLDDAIEKYSTTYKKLLKENDLISKDTKLNGKTYFLGRPLALATNHYVMIRKDWLDKLNLPIPQTTEDYLKVAKAFTDNDPDGNGKKDTLGSTFWDVDYFFGLGQSSLAAESAGPVTSYFIKNDEYVRQWEQPKAALAFKKALYDAGAVDKDIYTDKTGVKAQQDWVNGKLGIWGGSGLEGAAAYNVYDTLKKNNPDAQVVILPLPKSEFGQFSPAGGQPMQFTAAVNATCKNVEAVIKYVDWMMQPDVSMTLAYGFEGVHYTKDPATGFPKPIDAAKNKKELTWNADFSMLANNTALGKGLLYSNQLDASKPLDKEYLALIEQGRAAYLTPDRPYTISVNLPTALPDDLLLISNTVTNTIVNIYTKAVVAGASYTADQAIKDAQDAWEKAGGKKIDDFYAKVFKEQKANLNFTKDYYKYLQK
ncbi:MAG: extracellular solute-binding protein [Paenibacillaceae bacterium]|jgi:putative aldouronate transport system substrate-binding protein|nr:extracellular solute-binding protein [Paenibacillaceae bacterium]